MTLAWKLVHHIFVCSCQFYEGKKTQSVNSFKSKMQPVMNETFSFLISLSSQQVRQWKNWPSAVFRQEAGGLFPGLRLLSCAWLTAAGRVRFVFKAAWNSSTETCVAALTVYRHDLHHSWNRLVLFFEKL